MKIWNDFKTTYEKKLSFSKIQISNEFQPIDNGYILLHYPNSSIGSQGNWIDLEDEIIYEEGVGTSLKTLTEYEFQQEGVKMFVAHPQDIPNIYFWSDEVQTDKDKEIEGDTSKTDPTIGVSYIAYKKYSSNKVYQDKEQVSYDMGETYEDTGNRRNSEFKPSETDTCDCGGLTTQWFEDGEICDGANKCKLMEQKYKDVCEGIWKSYEPKVYKIGDVIEYDSEWCGTSEFKQDWDGESYICDGYDKYKQLFYWIKNNETEGWQKICLDNTEKGDLVKRNSFYCGWSSAYTTSEVRPEKDLCGKEAAIKYPSLSFVDTNKYDVMTTITTYHVTKPYPDNTDDMAESEWQWETTSTTSYSRVTTESHSCDCGYFYNQWDDIEEYKCGSELNTLLGVTTYTPTTKYKAQKKYEYCGDNKIPESGDATHEAYTAETRWVIYDNTSCECGYRVGKTKFYTGDSETVPEYIWVCGEELNADEPSLTINRLSIGDKYPTYNDYIYRTNGTTCGWDVMQYDKTATSPTGLSDNECTVITLFINATETVNLNITVNQSSEYNYDYLWVKYTPYDDYFGDRDVTKDNYNFNTKGVNGERTYTIQGVKSGYISMMYLKDGSQSEGTDNVTVTFSAQSQYDNGYMYYKRHYVTYEECVDGSNYNVISNETQWIKGSHSSSNVTTCEYDAETKANTTQVYTVYRTYDRYYYEYNTESKSYDLKFELDVIVHCGGKDVVISETKTKKSSNCGYYEIWDDIDSGCTGYISDTYGIDTSSEYGRYYVQVRKYTTNYNDAEPIWIETDEYRLGNIIEYQSEECGYIPRYSDWKLVCGDDITYETAETGDTTILITKNGKQVEVNCVICETYNGAPTMFATEVRRYSDDYGETWYIDDYPELRTERILKWKALKCGYEGDITREVIDETLCIDGIKYNKRHQEISSDNGQTWTAIPNTSNTVEIGTCEEEPEET